MVLQVNRTNNLKIPKEIEITTKSANNIEDIVATRKGIAMAKEKNSILKKKQKKWKQKIKK